VRAFLGKDDVLFVWKACSRLFAYLFLALFLFPSLSAAEIVIEPRVGFHGIFQLGHPFPLEVELSNSSRPVEGRLEIQVWKGGPSKGGHPYPFYYRNEVFLSSHSRKSLQLTVDPDFISRPLTITFTSPAGKVSREIDLRRHFSPAPVMLLISESNTTPSIPLGSTSPKRLVSVSMAEMPPDPRALLGVSTLILYDQSLRDLSHSQTRALETWLTTGGTMVILASLNTALYQEPAISRFLPVRVLGAKKIPSLAGLRSSSGARGSMITDVWAHDAKVVAGRVLIEEQGSPILVEAQRGKGRIFYLSLDIGRPPLSNWDGLPTLFKNILEPGGESSPTLRANWDESVFFGLFLNPSFISTYVPTASLFFALLGYIAVIGFFAWLWHRKRLPRRTVVLCALSFVLLSGLGGHLFFSRGGNIPDGVLVSSAILESISDGYVEVQANVALFSTQMRQFDLQVERGWIDLIPVPSRSKLQEDPAIVAHGHGNTSRFLFPLREWDYRLLKFRFIERFPLHVAIENRGDKIFMKVNNQAARDLTDCWLLVSGQRFFLGDIGRGTSWTKEFPLARHSSGAAAESFVRSEGAELRDISFKDKTRDFLFHSSIFPRDSVGRHWRLGDALFFGWVKEPDRRVWIEDQRIWSYDYALFRTIIPLAAEEDA